MGIYASIELVINEMILELTKNQNVMKYIVYDDVLIDPISKPTITNTQSYIYRSSSAETMDYRLFSLPKIPTITEEKKTLICCWFKSARPDGIYFQDYMIVFDIICHLEIWQISGGIIRPLRIMDEINDIFSSKNTSNSIGKLIPLAPQYLVYDSRGLFCGYRLSYQGTDFTKNLCGS
jgi:hypothetical protein